MLRHFSHVRLCATPQTEAQPTRLPRPWDSPGKNTGVGCHFLLQCIKVKSESEVTQSCPTLSNPMDCSLPGSSVHGIFQVRVLEWVAIAIIHMPLCIFGLHSLLNDSHEKQFHPNEIPRMPGRRKHKIFEDQVVNPDRCLQIPTQHQIPINKDPLKMKFRKEKFCHEQEVVKKQTNKKKKQVVELDC